MNLPLSSTINEQFIPINYSIEFLCSESNLEENLVKLASFTSKVYAKFASLDREGREQLKQGGVWMGELNHSASLSECVEFEKRLSKRIIEILNQKERGCNIQLSTNYYPEGILLEIAQSTFKNIQLGMLFPYKTFTHISLNDTKLCLNMNFKGPEI